jgi:maltose O-acetyltransferase
MLQGCIIDDSHCHRIKIGNNVTLAPRVHILAHDASPNKFIGVVKEGDVIIGNNVFIGANSTILCDTIIGDNVIIGANSVVTKDIPSNSVYGGNPAKFICTTEEYLKKVKEEGNARMTYLKTTMLEKVVNT